MAEKWISSLFGDVDAAIAQEITGKLESIVLARGNELFHTGDIADAIYVIAKGKIKLSHRYSDADPRRESLLTVLGDGSVFGELSVLDPGPRTTTATAIGSSQILRLSSEDFYSLLAKYPQLQMGMLHQLARRLRQSTGYASDLVLNDVHGRTARTIMHLSDVFGEKGDDGIIVNHGLTQQEIAHMVGASRETVNKFLMELTEQGELSLSYRAFVVLDPEAITARAHRRTGTAR